MKNFIYGSIKKPQKPTYINKVLNITYYYDGNKNDVIFVEEFAYKALINLNIENVDSETFFAQVLLILDSSYYFITLNKEESTVKYSLNEFSEDEIFEFISDLIITDQSFYILKKNDDKISLLLDNEEKNVSFLQVSNNCTVFTAGSIKFIKWFKRNFVFIFLFLILIIIPFVESKIFNKIIIQNQEIKIKQLKKQKMILNINKSKYQEKIIKLNTIYNKTKKKQNLLNDSEKLNTLIDQIQILNKEF